MDHGACVAGIAEVLASKEVGEAAEKACLRVHPREKDAKAACMKYVKAIAAAPQQGFIDATHLCDRLLTGKANGTQGFDEDHFVYSCVQYASNLIATAPRGQGSVEKEEKVAEDVRKNCKEHLSDTEQGFCEGYADLVKRRATRQELVSFCDSQYRKMHDAANPPIAKKPENATVSAAQKPVATPAPPAAAAPPEA